MFLSLAEHLREVPHLVPRLVVLSYPRFTRQVGEQIQRNPFEVKVDVVDTSWDTAVAVARELEARRQADAFITGGAHAKLVRPTVSLPVVEFSVSGFDLLEAVSQAAAYGRVVPVISYSEPIQDFGRVAPLLNVTVKPVSYQSPEDLSDKLAELRSLGVRAVVGSSMVCDYAEQMGLKAVLIYSRAAIYNAIRVAMEAVRTRQLEIERSERFRAIVDFAYGGILSTDETGRVTVFNAMAEQILGVSAERAVGRPVSDLIPNSLMEETLQTGTPVLNQVHKVNGGPIVVNWVPINVAGRVRGLATTFQDAATIQRAEQKIRKTLAERGLSAQYTFQEITASSPAMQQMLHKARGYARSHSTVLILGETGTGKELFAQSIHNDSPRRQGPFVAVNCAALPENLLESELFGYEEGAFTGARRGGKSGLFEMAHGGTVFLDEIGEIPATIQVRLLRVLQERQIMRLGSNRVVPVDIRVIAATNRNLEEEVQQGRFRADLFYRLNILRLELPSLRERVDDMPHLVQTILQRYDTQLAAELSGYLPELLPLMSAYSWPGNVRELENVVERFLVTVRNGGGAGDARIQAHQAVQALKAELRALRRPKQQADEPHEDPTHLPPARVIPSPLSPIPLGRILQAISEAGGNRSEAARRLGISRTTLYRRLERICDEVPEG